MKLKGLFILSNVFVITILVIIVLLAKIMNKNQIELSRLNQNYLKAHLISEELAQTSEDLTNYCRSYVATGGSIWERKYWEVLDIRNGKKPRPNGRTITLFDSIKSLDLTVTELQYLRKAEIQSNYLTYTEKAAFNAMKGLFADGSGNFSVKREPDTAFARRIMFDSEYAKNKSQIFTPIKDFNTSINKRISDDLFLHREKNQNLLHIIIILGFAIIIIKSIAFFLNYSKITEELKILKKTKDDLLYSKNRLIQTTEIAKVGGWSLNLADNKLTWSNQTKRIHKVANTFEPTLENALAFYLSEDRPIIQEKVKKAIAHGEPFSEDLRILNKGNEVIWVRSNGEAQKKDNDIVGINGTIQDINDQKLLELELAHKKQLLSYAERIGNVGGWEFNTETLKQTWTEHAYRIFEVDAEKIQNVNDGFNFVKLDSKKILDKSIRRAIKFGEDFEVEFEIVTPKGLYKTIKSIAKTDLKNKRIYGFVEDVTKRKEAESIIEEQHHTLKKLNDDKNRFISILAHDLKSPFSGILGLLEILTENIKDYDKDQIQKYLSLISKSSNRIYNLLENILTWVRSETGKLPFKPETIKLDTVCKKVIKNLEVLSKSKEITIKTYIKTTDVCYADQPMITTTLHNLISNAIKYTYVEGLIDIYFKADNTFSEIKIVDNGIGMEKEQLSKLFNISETKSMPGTLDEQGTGLGLIICKEFVDRHGGQIWAESTPGKGSTFYIKLPVKQNLQS